MSALQLITTSFLTPFLLTHFTNYPFASPSLPGNLIPVNMSSIDKISAIGSKNRSSWCLAVSESTDAEVYMPMHIGDTRRFVFLSRILFIHASLVFSVKFFTFRELIFYEDYTTRPECKQRN